MKRLIDPQITTDQTSVMRRRGDALAASWRIGGTVVLSFALSSAAIPGANAQDAVRDVGPAAVLGPATSAPLPKIDEGKPPLPTAERLPRIDEPVVPIKSRPEVVEIPASRTAKRPKPTVDQICTLISTSAERYNLPKDYFARLIWKESRFDHLALSPVGAQGIAQFMPSTAKIVGLKDPWDVAQAIPASANHLNDLRNEFGNLGLAAAAYNAGAQRVSNWLQRGGFLPLETEDYVASITGEAAAVFGERSKRIKLRPLDPRKPFDEACRNMRIVLTRAASVHLNPDGTVMAAVKPKPWGIQIAGNFKRSVVQRAVSRLKRKLPRVLGKRQVYIQKRRTAAGRRSIYAARIGANSRAEANRICGQLRAAGGACVVSKN